MKSYNIAIIPGDGVGGEIAKEAVKIMDAVNVGDVHKKIRNLTSVQCKGGRW